MARTDGGGEAAAWDSLPGLRRSAFVKAEARERDDDKVPPGSGSGGKRRQQRVVTCGAGVGLLLGRLKRCGHGAGPASWAAGAAARAWASARMGRRAGYCCSLGCFGFSKNLPVSNCFSIFLSLFYSSPWLYMCTYVLPSICTPLWGPLGSLRVLGKLGQGLATHTRLIN